MKIININIKQTLLLFIIVLLSLNSTTINAQTATFEKAVEEIQADNSPLKWENTLTITGDGTSEQKDIILIVDISKSMYKDADHDDGYSEASPKMASVKEALETLMRALIGGGHRIGLVYFGSSASKADFTTDIDELLYRIGLITYNGSKFHNTNITLGIDLANSLIDARIDNTNEVTTLLLSDGAPTDATFSEEYASGNPVYVNLPRLSRFYYAFNQGKDMSPFGVEMDFISPYFYFKDYAASNDKYLTTQLEDGVTYGDSEGYYFYDGNKTAPDKYTGTTPVTTKGYFSRELSPLVSNFQSGGYYDYHTNEIRPFTDPNDPYTWPILEQITSWSADRLKSKSDLFVIGFELDLVDPNDPYSAPGDFVSTLPSASENYIPDADQDNINQIATDLIDKFIGMNHGAVVVDNLPSYLDFELPDGAVPDDETNTYSWEVSAELDGGLRTYTLSYNEDTHQLSCDVGNIGFTEPLVFTYYTTLADNFDYANSNLSVKYDVDGHIVTEVDLNGETNLSYNDIDNDSQTIDADIPVGPIPVTLSIEKKVVSAETYSSLMSDNTVSSAEFSAIAAAPQEQPLVSDDAYYIFKVTNNTYQNIDRLTIQDQVGLTYYPTDRFSLSAMESKLFAWGTKFTDESDIAENTATLKVEVEDEENEATAHEIEFVSNTVYVLNAYSVIYQDGVEGKTITVPTDRTVYYSGDQATVSSTVPIRTGYTFKNWSSDLDGNDEFVGGEEFAIANSDVILTAQWTLDPPTAVGDVVCSGDISEVTASHLLTDVSYSWYESETGSTILSSQQDFQTTQESTASTTVDYWVAVTDTYGVISSRVIATVTVNALPIDQITGVTTDPTCVDQTGTFTISSPTASSTYVLTGPGTSTREQQGTSFTGLASGVYSLIEINSSGCESESTTVTIADIPDGCDAAPVNDFNSGIEDNNIEGDITDNDDGIDNIIGYIVDGVDGEPELGVPFEIPGVGEITISADGSYTFIPQPDWFGDVPNITYSVDVSGVVKTAILELEVIPTYDVIYKGNGADSGVPIDDDSYLKGATLEVSDQVPVKDGFEFNSWKWNRKLYDGEDELSMPGKNVTFTAQWKLLLPEAEGVEICVGDDATLTASHHLTAATLKWYTQESGGSFVSKGASYTVSPTVTTDYWVTATMWSYTSDRVKVTVTVKDRPEVWASTTNAVICRGESVTLNAGGTADSYSWDNGVEDNTPFEPTETKTYTVTGTGTNGCPNTAQVTVTVHEPPVVTISATNDMVCAGESVILTGEGADSYTWDNGVIDGRSFVPTETKSYTVTGRDETSGCTSTAEITIIVNPIPYPPIVEEIIQPTCDIQTGSFIVNDSVVGSTYTLTGNGITISLGAGVPFTELNPGVYYLTETTATGCESGELSIVINDVSAACDIEPRNDINSGIEDHDIVGNVTDNDDDIDAIIGYTVYGVSGTPTLGDDFIIPNVGTINIASDGSYTFTPDPNWFGTVPQITYSIETEITTKTATLDLTVTPTYEITYKGNGADGGVPSDDASYSSGDTAPVSSQVPTKDGFSFVEWKSNFDSDDAGSAKDVLASGDNFEMPSKDVVLTAKWALYTPSVYGDDICSGSSAVISATHYLSGASFKWYTQESGGSYVYKGANYTVSPTVTTDYWVSAIMWSYYSARVKVTVTVREKPEVFAFTTNSIVCEGESVTLTGGGADSYTWDNGVVDGSPFIPTESKDYTVTGVGSNGCTSTAIVSVIVNPAPEVTAITNNETICLGESVTLTGGGADSYIWDNGVEDGTPFEPTETKTYTVTGIDAGTDCSSTAQVTVTVLPTPYAPIAGVITHPTCDLQTGSFDVIDPVASSIYTLTGPGYSSNTQEGTSFSGLYPGEYYLTETNASGCESGSTTVTINAVPEECDLEPKDDYKSGVENRDITGDVTVNDDDIDEITGYTVYGVSGTPNLGEGFTIPDVGEITIASDGSYTFSPETDWNGKVPQITYSVNVGDDDPIIKTATLNLTITPTYEVIYDGNEADAGTTPSDGNSYLSDASVHVSDAVPTKENHTFLGWTSDFDGPDNGNDNDTFSDGDDFLMPSQNVTLTAQWYPDPIATDDAKATGKNTTMEIGYGEHNLLVDDKNGLGGTTGLSITDFTVDLDNDGDQDFVAIGVWVTIIDENGLEAGDIKINDDGTYTLIPATDYVGKLPLITYTLYDGVATDEGELQLHVTQTYTITYLDGVDDDIIDVPTDDKTYRENSDAIVSTVLPVRPGYTFINWQSDFDDDDSDGDDVNTIFSAGDNFKMPKKNVTLTAIWSTDIAVETNYVNNITATTAKLHGTVTAGDGVEGYGFVWSYTDNDETTLDSGDNIIEIAKDQDLTVTGDILFSSDQTFDHRKNVYFRAYARKGTASEGYTYTYGKVIRFLSEKRDFSLSLDDGNSALILDKTSTAASVNNLTGDQFSVEFWFKNEGATTGIQTIISNEATDCGYEIILDLSGHLGIKGGDTDTEISDITITDNEWHHVAFIAEYGSLSSPVIYVDGVASTLSPIELVKPTSDAVLTIGADYSNSQLSNHFTGKIDALRFWDCKLSSEALSTLDYDNIEESTDNNVQMIGSGTEIELAWDKLLASFNFNVRSTNEVIQSHSPTVCDTQEDMHEFPFFHEDSRLATDNISFNLASIGNARPSPDLPRVNWRHNAGSDSWLYSDNWSGYAFPGQGLTSDEISTTTFDDVSNGTLSDTENLAEYTVLNIVGDNSFVPVVTTKIFLNGGTSLSINILVDREEAVKTYQVDSSSLDGSLKIKKAVRRTIFGTIIESLNNGVIIVESGSVEAHDDI